jgi:hypothetical protein
MQQRRGEEGRGEGHGLHGASRAACACMHACMHCGLKLATTRPLPGPCRLWREPSGRGGPQGAGTESAERLLRCWRAQRRGGA